MTLGEKIYILRTEHGLSQEAFGESLGVSRQSVSKWEGAQSVPDLNKILLMSRIFEVSTDYLLKDELEEPDGTQNTESLETGGFEESVPARRVSMEEARAFLDIKEKLAGKIAEKGYTLVPLQVYFKGSLVKVEIGLARGKKLYDKREDIAKKDQKREIEREFKVRNL